MPYGPTSPLGGTRIFYSSTFTLGLWTLFYSGLNDLLKSNFRFSKILSPGEPLQSRWSPTAPEDSEVTIWCSLETLCPSLLLFPTTDKSLWITTYTCHSYDHSPLFLLLQDTPKFSLLIREYLVPTVLQFLVTWIPLWIILALVEYPLIPSCSCVSQKSSK